MVTIIVDSGVIRQITLKDALVLVGFIFVSAAAAAVVALGDGVAGGRGVQRAAGHPLGLVQIQHRDRPRLAQCQVVGVAAVFQRPNGLLANRLAGHQPQNHAVLGAQKVGINEQHAFCCQPGLAAAGGHAQAEVRHIGWKSRQRVVRIATPPQAFGGGGKGNRG